MPAKTAPWAPDPIKLSSLMSAKSISHSSSFTFGCFSFLKYPITGVRQATTPFQRLALRRRGERLSLFAAARELPVVFVVVVAFFLTATASWAAPPSAPASRRSLRSFSSIWEGWKSDLSGSELFLGCWSITIATSSPPLAAWRSSTTDSSTESLSSDACISLSSFFDCGCWSGW